MLRRVFLAALLSASATFGLAQIKAGQIKNPPNFNSQKLSLGAVKLNANQMRDWSLLMSTIKQRPPATALIAQSTGYTKLGSFPDPANEKMLYASPQKTTKFLVQMDALPSARTTLVLQVANKPTSGGMIPPYTGWEMPQGLLYTQEFLPPIRSKPEDSSDDKTVTLPVAPGFPDLGSVTATADSRYTYIQASFPPPNLNKTGTVFYARVVPLLVRDGKKTPIGPASNWVKFYVTITEAEQQKQIQDAKIAIAKSEAEKQNLKLVTDSNEARKALWAAYEIRLLSYIPPKFSDDNDAPLYFVANRMVDVTYDGGKKVVNLSPGETYYTVQMKNLLNSNKSWQQELWDVVSATLNMASSAYMQAKNAAVNTLASGLNKLPGVNCQGACKETLMTGLNMALAYCGIPPSLPNINELYNKGLDYMAASLADIAIEQATGVALEDFGANAQMTMMLSEQAKGPAKDAMKSFLRSMTEPVPFVADIPETWGYPAPFFRRRPAMLYLEIRRKPNSKAVVGQSWQSINLKFGATFVDIPMVLLPKLINDKVRVPIALATTEGPEKWSIKGMMPEKNIDPASGVGQPYYGDRGNVSVMVTTTHRLGASDTTFKTLWPGFTFSSGYVNARPLPDKAITTSAETDAALEKPIALGPVNYYGKIKLRWFELP